MLLKGLPKEYEVFATVVTQKDTPMTFQNFKTALRNFEEVEKTEDTIHKAVMNVKEKKYSSQPTLFIPNEPPPDLTERVFLAENSDVTYP